MDLFVTVYTICSVQWKIIFTTVGFQSKKYFCFVQMTNFYTYVIFNIVSHQNTVEIN